MGKVNGGGSAFWECVDDGGVIAHGGDLVFGIEGKNHGVVEEGFSGYGLGGVPAEAMLEDGEGFHFADGAKVMGQGIEADLKERVVGGFDKVEDDTRQLGVGGALIAGGEICGDEFWGVAQTKVGAWLGILCAEAMTGQVSFPFWVLMPVRSPGWRWVAMARPWSAMSSMKG